jgi:aldehyde dehydrogenase (NAD+)
MTQTSHTRIRDMFTALGALPGENAQGLKIHSPCDGQHLWTLATDTPATLHAKLDAAATAQTPWASLPRDQRAQRLEALAAHIRQHRDILAEIITLDGGKTAGEALAEADGSADILLKTIKDASLPEFGGMLRRKERPPVGIVGLITSFNFPLAVAGWTIAPALLAGNAVLWKPSEKTPLVAHAYKAIFNEAMGEHRHLLDILTGTRDIGEALVAHERIDMISATGSVAMGNGIRAVLAAKTNRAIPPILELGGNNAVVISDKLSPGHLEWSVGALLNSFFGTSGQRCTNTRRLLVHASVYLQVETLLKNHVKTLLAAGIIQNPLSGASNDYGCGPLIDHDAYTRFETAKTRVRAEGGTVLFGARLLADAYPNAYYVEPALALLPAQSPIMFEETFAPLLFIAPYDGDIALAASLANAPDNAGLVNGIYTQSQPEADRFAALNRAGHSVINSPKGTGTPAFGMGFGGNKASGEGEILNAADPLRAFTRADSYNRIAQNKDIIMDWEAPS